MDSEFAGGSAETGEFQDLPSHFSADIHGGGRAGPFHNRCRWSEWLSRLRKARGHTGLDSQCHFFQLVLSGEQFHLFLVPSFPLPIRS